MFFQGFPPRSPPGISWVFFWGIPAEFLHEIASAIPLDLSPGNPSKIFFLQFYQKFYKKNFRRFFWFISKEILYFSEGIPDRTSIHTNWFCQKMLDNFLEGFLDLNQLTNFWSNIWRNSCNHLWGNTWTYSSTSLWKV